MPKPLTRFWVRVRADERGLTSIGILMAVVFTLMVAVIMVNMLLYLYGQGAARAAIDEGVRAGSRAGAGQIICQQRAEEALLGLMPGPLGNGVQIECGVVDGVLVAEADVVLDSPLPGMPSWSFQMEAQGVQETGE